MESTQTLQTLMGFVEGSSPHQKLIDGKVFPKILLPPPPPHAAAAAADPHQMLQLFRTTKAFLQEQLRQFGALLLRGFPLHSADDFNALVDAIGWEEVLYVGVAPRTQIVGRVYSASDASPEVNIPFHHEMMFARTGVPSKILFFCDVEPADGGQTPIVLSHKITEKMREEFPDFVRKLEAQGLLYIKVLPFARDPSDFAGQAWPTVFGTTDRTEAEKRAELNFGSRLKWLAQDEVAVITGPSEAIRALDEQRERKVWCNSILVHGTQEAKCGGGESGDNNGGVIAAVTMPSHRLQNGVAFADGSPLPMDVVTRCKQLHEEMCVDIPWQKGDTMILDNRAVMHGRRPCFHPRRILVALCR